MSYFSIIADTTCDLSAAQAEEMNLILLPVGLTVGTSSFMHYADCRELAPGEFYAAMRAGMKVGTSATPPVLWLDAMEKELSQGRDVLVFPLASTLTGGYANACIAASELREQYPDRQLIVIDTFCASAGTGLLLKMVVRWRREGMSAAEAASHAETAKMHIAHIFTVDSLEHLRRGGRISTATAIVGSVLSMKPILSFDTNGKLGSVGKTRGRKNALNALADMAAEYARGGAEAEFCITHADCESDATILAEAICKRLGAQSCVSIACMCPVLAAHAGPGGLALFFVGKRPKHLL